LNVDAENLPAMTKAGLARELIQYLDRREQLTRLIEVGRQVRPNVDWTGLHLGDAPTDPIPQPPVDRLVVVLDQFEELFLRVGSRQRATFFAEVAAALDRPEPDVRFVFSLREDYLARLDEARDVLPDVFVNPFRLTPLDRSNARVAVTEPAARAKVKVEPALVDALVGGEGRGSKEREVGALVEEDGRVPPAALQIVLDYLYRAALPPGHDPAAAPPEGVGLTLDAYRAVHHEQRREGEEARILTGAEAILAGYVREGLARLADLKLEDDETSLGADPELGEAILKVMVTSEGTKAALTHDEILNRLDQAGAVECGDPADEALVKNTRLGLQRVRLLRGFERDGQALYELAHDHLAAEIATWITEEEMAARLVRELLTRAMDDWRSAGLLIRPEVLALIHERREDLRHLSAEELELLFRSALAAEGTGAGDRVAYWRGRCPAVVGKVERELFGALEGEDPEVAEKAVSSLAAMATDEIVGRLAEVVDADFRDEPVVWFDHLGERYELVHTVLNLITARQQRVVDVLRRLTLPAAVAALDRWTPPGMILIPAGLFLMGSEEGSDDEKPVHEVWLESFWIDRYPVTNAQWAAFLEGGGWERRELWTEAGWGWKQRQSPAQAAMGKKDHPVVEVCWYESLACARWMGKRLLSEAEWEKAAAAEPLFSSSALRAELLARKRKYPWGDEFDAKKCNTRESGVGDTTPVGRYSPAGDSPYGVADMAGNVWEWCCNLYVPYPYKAGDGREELEGTGHRVLRGGSFFFCARDARAARRPHYDPDIRYRSRGVRVAAPFSPRSVL
jgi:formylglycine-generating enzyme required for sulfatase activity